MRGGWRVGCAAGGMLTDTDNHTRCGLSKWSEQEMFLQENRSDTTKIATAKAPGFVVEVIPDGRATTSRNPSPNPSSSPQNKSADLKVQTGRLVSNTKKRQAKRVRVIHQFNPSPDISSGLSYLLLVSLPTQLVWLTLTKKKAFAKWQPVTAFTNVQSGHQWGKMALEGAARGVRG